MEHLPIFIFIFFSVRAESTARWNPSIDECPTWEDICIPTVKTMSNFNATKVAALMQVSLECQNPWPFIEFIPNIDEQQRQELDSVYQNLYGQDLFGAIKTKLWAGQFRNFIRGLMRPLRQFYAFELSKLINRICSNNPVHIIAILGPLSNNGIKAVAEQYSKNENFSEEPSLDGDLRTFAFAAQHDQKFEYFLPALAMGNRKVKWNLKKNNINELVNQLKGAASEENYAKIGKFFLEFSPVDLRKVFREFENSTKKDVNKKLEQCPDNLFRKMLLTSYKIAENRTEFFADILYSSFGNSDHRTIRRILVGRSSIDLGTIMRVYKKKYKISLARTIERESDKSYRETLLNLIRDPPKTIMDFTVPTLS